MPIGQIRKCNDETNVVNKEINTKSERERERPPVKEVAVLLNFRAGHFRYFLILSLIKIIFCIFYQANLTGSGLFK